MNYLNEVYHEYVKPIARYTFDKMVSMYEKIQSNFTALASWFGYSQAQASSLNAVEIKTQNLYIKKVADLSLRTLKCTICLDGIGKTEVFIAHEEKLDPEHKHVFHKECMEGWLKEQNSCPICKEELSGYSKSKKELSEEEERAQRQEVIEADFVQCVNDLDGPAVENYLREYNIGVPVISGVFNQLVENINEAVNNDFPVIQLVELLVLIYQTDKVPEDMKELAKECFSELVLQKLDVEPQESLEGLLVQIAQINAVIDL
jgi:hypothetical protein